MSVISAGRRGLPSILFVLASTVLHDPASASEAIAYSYDALGRLVQVNRSGSVNDGKVACYSYDKAGNRTNVTLADLSCTGPGPTFSVNDVSATEGSSQVFTVSKSGSTTSSFSVNYTTANGSAASGSDYTAVSGMLTFAASETSKTVSVPTTDDTTVESAETLYLDLSNASAGSSISDAQGVGTINDNDSSSAAPSFSINDKSVYEGSTITFTVTKSGSTTSSYSVNFATADGSAQAGSDYNAKSGTLTFAASETSKTISVSTIEDLTAESLELFYVNLSGASGGATISDNQGRGTINDDDAGGIQ